VQKAVFNWNELLRRDLLALRVDALRTIERGIEENNAFAVNVGKRSLGTYLARNQGDHEAIRLLQEAAFYFVKIGDEVLATETYNELGNAHLLLGNTDLAIQAFLTSLDYGKSSSDPTSAFLAEVNLAQAYLVKGDTAKACGLLEDYKRRSMQLKKFEAVANAYVVLGEIAQAQSKKALSLEYFQKSAGFGIKSKARFIRAQALTNLAIVAFEEGRKDEAKRLFFEAYRLYTKVGSTKRIAESMNNLGEFFVKTNQLNTSLSWYLRTMRYSAQLLMLQPMNDAHTGVIEVYQRLSNLPDALEHMKLYDALKDSVILEKELLKTEQTELVNNLNVYSYTQIEASTETKNEDWYKGIVWGVLLGFFLCIFLMIATKRKFFNSDGVDK
jgi:tetratricopeptide (TPR) repeat protein